MQMQYNSMFFKFNRFISFQLIIDVVLHRHKYLSSTTPSCSLWILPQVK